MTIVYYCTHIHTSFLFILYTLYGNRRFPYTRRGQQIARRIFENIICMCCRALFLTLNARYSGPILFNKHRAKYTRNHIQIPMHDCRGAMQMNQNMRTIAMMLCVLVYVLCSSAALTNNTLVCIANSMVKS